MKNLDKKVSRFYKKLDKKLNYSVTNETIFRLLGNNNISFKNKNILDFGIGNGDNLLEFKRRGGNIFGVDIRKKIIKLFVDKNNLKQNNFFACDLNYNFPKINKKMDLVLCKDTIYYLTPDRQFTLFKEVDKILKKGGFFLIQYIQCQLKKIRKDNFFSFDLNKKSNFRPLKKYFQKGNPLPFLGEKHISKLIKSQNFKLKNNIFDINTHTKNGNIIITINRYFLLQK